MVALQMLHIRAMNALRTLRDDEEGQGLVEYALIIAGVSVALIIALGTLAGDIKGVFTEIGEAF